MLAALALALAAVALPAKKKKEEETQVLQLPKELPSAIAGDTRRLSFYVTPLSAKGLLSQQAREALKNLERQAAGNSVIAIRAFVAGSGDLRRVRDLVSETFTERRQPLPVLSLIQAGALPLTGAQVVLEAIVNGRRDLYSGGLAFVPAEPAYSEDPLSPVRPLLDRTMSNLRSALQAAGAMPSDVLRITCFLSSLDQFDAVRQQVEAEYPHAAQNFVQAERGPQRAVAACEATAAIRESVGAPLEFRGTATRVTLLRAPQLVITGTQVSFGYEEQDARLAFERLGKTLEPLGVSMHDIAFARFYPLSPKIGEQVRRLEPAFFGRDNPPAVSVLEFEGLASSDAGFAIDVVAAKE